MSSEKQIPVDKVLHKIDSILSEIENNQEYHPEVVLASVNVMLKGWRYNITGEIDRNQLDAFKGNSGIVPEHHGC